MYVRMHLMLHSMAVSASRKLVCSCRVICTVFYIAVSLVFSFVHIRTSRVNSGLIHGVLGH